LVSLVTKCDVKSDDYLRRRVDDGINTSVIGLSVDRVEDKMTGLLEGGGIKDFRISYTTLFQGVWS